MIIPNEPLSPQYRKAVEDEIRRFEAVRADCDREIELRNDVLSSEVMPLASAQRNELEAQVEVTTPPGGEDSDVALGFVRASDLSRTFPNLRRPIIHGLLRSGETMNIISAPKVGKSWLVTALAINASRGEPWLGYPCAKSKVLLIDNELHVETLANRVNLVSRELGINQSELFDLTTKNMRGLLVDFNKLDLGLLERIKKGRFDMVILDAFYRFLPAGTSENDNGAMAKIYNMIDGWAHLLDCCFVLIHHTSKGNQSEKEITDVGAGAGSVSRAADTHLIIRKHQEEKYFVLEAESRSFPKIEPKVLQWAFPLFREATEMNPKQLKNPRVRNDGWTTETFVKRVFGSRSLTPLEMKIACKKYGLSNNRIKTLRQDSVAEGLLIKTGSTKTTKYVGAEHAPSEITEVLPSKDKPPETESASALEG